MIVEVPNAWLRNLPVSYRDDAKREVDLLDYTRAAEPQARRIAANSRATLPLYRRSWG